MMNYELRIKLLIVAILVATTGVYAQKFPERRITRQGTKLYNKGDYTGAEAEYRRALELNPELREATFNLGGALWRQAQAAAQSGQDEQQQKAIRDRAVEATEAWMAIAGDSLAPAPMASAAGYNAGNVALAAQQLDAAIEAYKQSLRLRLRPDDMEAKFNLAYAQKMKQQQEDQNDDQNKDDQQDDGGGGGGNDQNDPNEDQNDEGNDQNDPQDGEGDQNDQNNQNDPQDGNGDGQNGNEPPPPPSGQGPGEAKMDRQAAEPAPTRFSSIRQSASVPYSLRCTTGNVEMRKNGKEN